MQPAASVHMLHARTCFVDRCLILGDGILMLERLPYWARPAARTALASLMVAAIFLSLAGLLTILLPSIAKLDGGVIPLVLALIGGTAFSVMVLSLTVIMFRAQRHGMW